MCIDISTGCIKCLIARLDAALMMKDIIVIYWKKK